jgi:hypothetical protein
MHCPHSRYGVGVAVAPPGSEGKGESGMAPVDELSPRSRLHAQHVLLGAPHVVARAFQKMRYGNPEHTSVA